MLRLICQTRTCQYQPSSPLLHFLQVIKCIHGWNPTRQRSQAQIFLAFNVELKTLFANLFFSAYCVAFLVAEEATVETGEVATTLEATALPVTALVPTFFVPLTLVVVPDAALVAAWLVTLPPDALESNVDAAKLLPLVLLLVLLVATAAAELLALLAAADLPPGWIWPFRIF